MAENERPNEKIKAAYVKCGHCGHRFHSPIFIGDTRTFEHALLSGNITNCPDCGEMLRCDKTNMSYTTEGGRSGGVGDGFSDNKL